ncbi:tRNA (guanosine(46)-N7)-methyltransferase TrmB [Kineococcus rhizosphaerae]|uniref:tRNA (guanosine(46)-N7)-methyltransferase TrmB n=1 Tax=Kineococcus rhizosphaerae TaxID=559628 RepID=UPI001FE6A11B|nr:tRNA (guanosine(46)-N7)-methyltransferase TrmB [Kineococcus rhizosphaerae]
MSPSPVPPGPPVQSFKLRRGRMGVVRQEALAEHLGRFEVRPDTDLDPRALFGDDNPVVLEIGSGMGDATLEMAQAAPDVNVLAAEVHTPGIGALLQGIVERGLTNVRLLEADGRAYLTERVRPATLAGVRVYFPDPWPKARHHKRRLVNPAFVALVADRLVAGGTLHCATDWEPYAEQMVEVIGADPAFTLDPDRSRPSWRPVTRFERRGLDLGHVVNDVLARRR